MGLAGALLAALLLTACGGQAKPATATPRATDMPAPTQEVAQAPAPTPQAMDKDAQAPMKEPTLAAEPTAEPSPTLEPVESPTPTAKAANVLIGTKPGRPALVEFYAEW
jgi:hypothetical protein